MKKPAKPFRFLLDAGAPDSVGKVLEAAGYDVIYHRQVLEEGTKDPVVCQTAILNEAVLVAVDADMKQLVKRFGSAADDRLQKLDLLMCGCDGVMASKRVKQALSLMEHEWLESQTKEAKRFRVEVTNHRISTWR